MSDRLRGWVAAAWIIAALPFAAAVDRLAARQERRDEQRTQRQLRAAMRALARSNGGSE